MDGRTEGPSTPKLYPSDFVGDNNWGNPEVEENKEMIFIIRGDLKNHKVFSSFGHEMFKLLILI